jgi:IS5 family transposase
MLRIQILQRGYWLIDRGMEEVLIEVSSMRRFAGIELIRDRIPDETTILTFRHLLKNHELDEAIFAAVIAHLSVRGMTIRQATIVNATVIAAPSTTKNKQGKRKPEMHQSNKATSGFGRKLYAGVTKDSGLIHSVTTPSANVHNLSPVAELLYGDEEVVYSDAGYQVIAKMPEMAGKTMEFSVAMLPAKHKALPDTPERKLQDLVETAKAHIRSKVTPPFRVIKKQFGFQKTRLRGLAKNRCKSI